MAARKKSTSKAVAKRGRGNSELRARLAEKTKGQMAIAKSVGNDGWPYVSTEGGQFRSDGGSVPRLPVIVAGFVEENSYFPGEYTPGESTPPLCFAVGKPDDPPKSLKPVGPPEHRQAETCADCPQNKFGSATKGSGKGKACKNGLRLALYPFDTSLEKLPESGILLRIPPTALSAFGDFTKAVQRAGYTSVQEVGCEMEFYPNPTRGGVPQHLMSFNMLDEVPDDQIDQILDRWDDIELELTRVPEVDGSEAAAASGAGGGKPKRKGTKKTGGRASAQARSRRSKV